MECGSHRIISPWNDDSRWVEELTVDSLPLTACVGLGLEVGGRSAVILERMTRRAAKWATRDPPPGFLVNVASKGFRLGVSSLDATVAGAWIDVDSKGDAAVW
jgi:hypothetical protein